MFGPAVIVFRETLEAALFIGIIAAATQGLNNRGKWLSLGILIGLSGSLLMALAIDQITQLADGVGQDILNVIVLLVALVTLSWHCISVSMHAKEMVLKAKKIGAAVTNGTGAVWVISLAVAMSVLREGAETVLFISGILSGQTESIISIIFGILLGLLLGCFSGCLVYFGLGKINPKSFFRATNILILLLVGSLSSQLAKVLNQADLVSYLGDKAWDTSGYINNESGLGILLHAVVGYDAAPSKMQILFYLGSVALIISATRYIQSQAFMKSQN